MDDDVAHIDRMLANWERESGKYAEALPLYLNALKIYDNSAVIVLACLTLGGLASNQIGAAQSMPLEEARRMDDVVHAHPGGDPDCARGI